MLLQFNSVFISGGCGGKISNSYASGSIVSPDGTSNVGGIIGYMPDRIPNSAYAGANAGYLFKLMFSGTMNNHLNFTNAGGLIGLVSKVGNGTYLDYNGVSHVLGSKNQINGSYVPAGPYGTGLRANIYLSNSAFDSTVNPSLDIIGDYVPNFYRAPFICTTSHSTYVAGSYLCQGFKTDFSSPYVTDQFVGGMVDSLSANGDVLRMQASGEQADKTTAELQSGNSDGDLDQWDDVNTWRFDGPGNYPKLRWLNP